jgi:hypothetical protein
MTFQPPKESPRDLGGGHAKGHGGQRHSGVLARARQARERALVGVSGTQRYSPGTTFNPKVAGSIPARPISVHAGSRELGRQSRGFLFCCSRPRSSFSAAISPSRQCCHFRCHRAYQRRPRMTADLGRVRSAVSRGSRAAGSPGLDRAASVVVMTLAPVPAALLTVPGRARCDRAGRPGRRAWPQATRPARRRPRRRRSCARVGPQAPRRGARSERGWIVRGTASASATAGPIWSGRIRALLIALRRPLATS